jgi:hypothetical protein
MAAWAAMPLMASPPRWDCSSSGGVAGEKCECNNSWSFVEYTDAV